MLWVPRLLPNGWTVVTVVACHQHYEYVAVLPMDSVIVSEDEVGPWCGCRRCSTHTLFFSLSNCVEKISDRRVAHFMYY